MTFLTLYLYKFTFFSVTYYYKQLYDIFRCLMATELLMWSFWDVELEFSVSCSFLCYKDKWTDLTEAIPGSMSNYFSIFPWLSIDFYAQNKHGNSDYRYKVTDDTFSKCINVKYCRQCLSLRHWICWRLHIMPACTHIHMYMYITMQTLAIASF